MKNFLYSFDPLNSIKMLRSKWFFFPGIYNLYKTFVFLVLATFLGILTSLLISTFAETKVLELSDRFLPLRHEGMWLVMVSPLFKKSFIYIVYKYQLIMICKFDVHICELFSVLCTMVWTLQKIGAYLEACGPIVGW